MKGTFGLLVTSDQNSPPRWRLHVLRLLICLATLTWVAFPVASAFAEEGSSRFCVGFLYCKETKGDTTTTEAFVYLYSTEERGTFSRLTLVPFYSREMDPAQHYVRRSILWPLGISERRGDSSYLQILPLYWEAEDPSRRYRVIVPLYFDYAAGDNRYTHVLPFYGHHQERLRHRYFVLGPVAIATYDKETELREWDVLMPLFHYGADRNGYETRFFPLYWAGANHQEGSWYRHLFPLYWSGGTQDDGRWYRHILPLYGRSVTANSDLLYLFPLYGSAADFPDHKERTSILGLPPMPQSTMPSLALYEHVSTPTSASDRLFPLYRYARDDSDALSDLNVIALFQLRRGPALTAHRLFPLYFYEDDRQADHLGWSFLGYDQISLAGYGNDPKHRWHQFVPLYRMSEDLTAQTQHTDALGLGPLSLFRYSRTPQGSSHRFIPLYWYDHPAPDEWHWSALVAAPLALYRHDEQGTAIHDRFFPLYDWDRNGDWREFSMLGVSWFSMFYRESGPTRVTNRLFPLYRYRHDLAADEVNMDTLLLHRHHTTPTRGEDRLLPLWEATWERDQPVWDLNLLGITPLTLFHHETTRAGTTDRFFPLYGYRSSPGGERRVAVLGFPPREAGFAWSLYEQGMSPTYFLSRFFPLYRYERDDETKEVNWSALLLYRHKESESHLLDTLPPLHEYERDDAASTAELSLVGLKPLTLFKQGTGPDAGHSFLFPLYDYDRTGDINRLSLLGFPKIGTFTTLSLFERIGTPSVITHRFFPLYRYNRNEEAKTLNWDAFLWWHRETAYWTQNVLYPFFDVEYDSQKDLHEVGVFGMRPLTFFQYRSSPTEYWHYAALFYAYITDGDQQRLSVLGLPHFRQLPALSLFAMERQPSALTHRFVPFYWYARDDQAQTRDWQALLLWWHRERDTHLRDFFLPLTDIERDAGTDSRRLSLLGLPKIGTLPPLTLFNWEQTPTTSSHRMLPLYSYVKDDNAHRVDWNALLLWWHSEQDTHLRDFVLPLSDVERDSASDSRRLSLLGLPKIGTLPPLTLFNWEQTPTTSSHRMLPLYAYGRDDQAQTRDWEALLLWWHREDPEQTRDMLLPLGSLRRMSNQQAWNFSALGVEPVSLVEVDKNPEGTKSRFSPLWDYGEEGSNKRLSFAGIRQLALFSYERSATGSSSHLFPVWWQHDSPEDSMNLILPLWSDFWNPHTGDRQLGVLGLGPFSLYAQHKTRTEMTARLFPIWDYHANEETQERSTGALGIPPLSLYYGYTSPVRAESRLFPFFRYTSDRTKNESEFWFLWPLYDQKRAEGRTTEASFLWWLFDYRSPKPDEWEYWVVGHPPMALFIRTVSPTVTHVEINPIIPGYRRETVEGVGTSWAILGGLIGMDAMPDGTHKLRLLWGLQL